MVPGFTLEKLSLDVVPLCWFIGDWIRFCNVIGFENLWIHCPHVIGFVADIFFSTLESGFKNIRIRYRIRRTRTEAIPGKKKA